MSTEQNKAVSRRFQEEFNNRNWAGCQALLTSDFVTHEAGAPGPMNAEAFTQMGQMFAAGFPDLHVNIQDQIAEANLVATRMTFAGTHTGNFQGIPPTGKSINVNGILVDRIANGKIAEHWSQFDAMGMMQQLGVIPTPGQGAA